MDGLLDILSRAFEHLLGRVSGPLNFRLVFMPTTATILAVLADRRDVREGRPTVLGAFFRDPAERRRLIRSSVKDIGRVFIFAITIDTVYQLIVFRWVYPGELLIVAVTCAIVPYMLVRGPIIRTARMLFGRRAAPDDAAARKAPGDDGHRRS